MKVSSLRIEILWRGFRVVASRAMRLLFLPTLLLFDLGGCAARIGPRVMAGDRFDYTEAVSRSWKEQMLLNVVKLRYMDPPMFMDVQQVIQQYTLEGTGSIFAPNWPGQARSVNPSATATGRWAESPTITYVPMSGETFTKSLVQPVTPVDLFSLIQSGWPIDAVFDVAVRSINGLNAGSRTAMFRRTGDPDFYRVISMMRQLQDTDSFGIRVDQAKERTQDILVFRAHQVDEPSSTTGRKVRELLHLDPDAQEFRLVSGAVESNNKEIAVLTRSMMEILAEASAGVEVPASDIGEGRAVKVEKLEGASDSVPRFAIRVRSCSSKPEATDAFAAVHYSDHWFWVDDRDVPSKRGLAFLMILFTLIESGNPAAPPALTISKP